LYRNPLVMLGMGPTYLFVLKFRLPLDMLHGRHKVLMSVMATNLAIFAVIVLVGLVIGFTELAMVQVPITMIASSIGVWLFYVQHQFENVYWSENKDWDFHQAAVEGSSFFDLPWGMRWFTANIGVHHVHHLCSRIPHYRLQACLKQIPELREVNRITLQGSLKTLRLALWDEERRRMVGFRALRQ
jgi:omega-6 fatty acid desaturase (delta-12 desaturase)